VFVVIRKYAAEAAAEEVARRVGEGLVPVLRDLPGFRAYYAFVAKGRFKVEYTVRLNNAGRFELPATRVEALYAPEMFGELPNRPLAVDP